MQRTDERSLVAQQKPDLVLFETPEINAETPAHLLDSDITPLPGLFVRNTGQLPVITQDGAAAAWTLAIDGAVTRPENMDAAAIAGGFRTGHRNLRDRMRGQRPRLFQRRHQHSALDPGRGRLRDMDRRSARPICSSACGVETRAVYTGHHSPDRAIEGDGPAISRGLPIAKAMAPETLIAYRGQWRAVALSAWRPACAWSRPGFPGSAWQKWLTRIEIRDREHDGERMTGLHYRMPRQPLRPGDPIDLVAIRRHHRHAGALDDHLSARRIFAARAAMPLTIRGYAWSGHIPVASVEIIDRRREKLARRPSLRRKRERFAWRRFELKLPSTPARRDRDRRARDRCEAANQPAARQRAVESARLLQQCGAQDQRDVT